MLDDMALRKLTEQTQRTYVRAVERFTRFFGTSPDLASPEDQRRFQMKLVSEGVSTTTINATILDRPEALKKMSPLKTPQKLPTVLSVDEVKRLLEAAPGLKARSALCVAYGAGLRASEVVHLKIADIDSERMILRIEQGKGRRDRYAMLAPSLLELLRRWYREAHTRGRMLPNGWLFPGQNQIDFIDAGLIGSRLDEAVELPGGERQYENVTI
jgi:integrase